MSFVGYRDFDQQTDEHQFEVLDFTDDPDDLTVFLAKVRAKGGADLAEDICGGFEKALQ